MMYHFFNIGTYPPSTKVLLRYVVMYVKISKVGVLLGYVVMYVKISQVGPWYSGGKHSFLQIYADFVPNWLNIIDWHSQLNIEVSSYGHKYQRSCFLSSSKILIIWLHSLPTSPQKYYAIYRRPKSTFGVFCQIYTFFVYVNASVKGNLELPLLKGRRRILRCIFSGVGESWPN